MAQLSDDFLNTVRRKLGKEGLPSGKATLTRVQIWRYLRGAENNPERAAENYVAFQKSHHVNESSEDKLSRERSCLRERDENQNDSPRKEEHIDLTSENEKGQVDEKSEQTKVPTRERSRSRDQHEGQNVKHQKPPTEPSIKKMRKFAPP